MFGLTRNGLAREAGAELRVACEGDAWVNPICQWKGTGVLEFCHGYTQLRVFFESVVVLIDLRLVQ
jgi:allophanate hydrolase subunit 1